MFCSRKQKAPHHDSEDDNSGKDTEEEKRSAKRTMVVKSGRAPKKSVNIRKEELEGDKWTLIVEAKRVLCKGCNKWKEMQRSYKTKEWERHKSVLRHHWEGKSESLELKTVVDKSCKCMHIR